MFLTLVLKYNIVSTNLIRGNKVKIKKIFSLSSLIEYFMSDRYLAKAVCERNLCGIKVSDCFENCSFLMKRALIWKLMRLCITENSEENLKFWKI